MTYILSKLIWHVLRPSMLPLLLSYGGLGLIWRRRLVWGNRLLIGGLGCYALILLLPVDSLLLLPLEDRYPRPPEPLHIDGIIELSGAIEPRLSADRGIVSLDGAAERMTETVALALRHPEARVVFTGANSDIIAGGPTEAAWARTFFLQQGVDPARVTTESASRNTYENGLNTWKMIQPRPQECWVLVTSASHMPRAIGVFRRIGWHVVPWPVDYRSGHSFSTWMARPMVGRLMSLDVAVHEWLGLLVYWTTGRTDALFPAPTAQNC